MPMLLRAQFNCSFTHYSSEDGLLQNTVMSIVQDHKGFMWFATWNGVARFDGYTFKTYKSSYGNGVNLTHNRVNYINEDKYGYLWMLTYDDRVNRFNPSTETFEQVPADKNISSINILSIKLLSSGTVWLLTERHGVMRIVSDSVSHKLSTVYYSEKSNFIPAHNVHNIYLDKNDNEWILGDSGLGLVKARTSKVVSFFTDANQNGKIPAFYSACESARTIFFGSDNGCVQRYDKLSKHFSSLQMPSTSKIIGIHCITPNDLLVVTESDGFFMYNISNNETTHYSPAKYKGFFDMPVLSIYVDKYSEVWFQQKTIGKVVHFNPFTKILKAEKFYVEPVGAYRGLPSFHIHEDCNGNTWVHPYGGGFSYFDRKQNCLLPFYNNPLSADWKFSNKIHTAYSDRQGNLWMCTHSKGLEKTSFINSPFALVQLTKASNHESLANEVRSLYEDSDRNMWVGLKDGYLRVYDINHKYLGFLTDKGVISQQGTPLKGVAYALTQDSKGNIWIGMKGDGLIRATKKGNGYELTRFLTDENDNYSLSDNNIYSIHEDAKGRIWIATFGGGINYIEPSPTEQVKFINYKNRLKGYPIDRCYRARYVTSDKSGRIWVGTTVGVLTFNSDFSAPENIQFEHYVHSLTDANSISNNDVHWIHVARDGNIYFATFGGGLNKLIRSKSKNTLTFKSYTEANGLSSDILLSMQEDKHGNLWLCTENGISKFVPSSSTFENYDERSFNFSTRFNEAASAKKQNGEFLFGTSAGVLLFNPDHVKKNNYVPAIVFTRFLVKNVVVVPGEKSILKKVINDVDELTLSHKENIFSLQFSALDLVAPSSIKYAYKLDGFDDNWSYVDAQRIATYTNLPKGKYILKVKSTNSDGVWVNNVRSLPITVLPSFWETPFAYVLYVLTVLLIIFIAVYILFTIFRLKHKVTIEQQISDIKLRFFTNISHELRTPLTLIGGPVEHVLQRNDIPQDARDQLKIVQNNSDRMLRLVNQILDFRKIQNKRMKLRVSNIEIVSSIRKIMENFETLAEERNIDFVLETESKAIYLWVDEDKFEKILFNLISNAFKYTPIGKMIKVFLREEEKTCIIGVQDQGIGIAENKKDSIFVRFENVLDKNLFDSNSTGIGLSLVKEFAEMHQATVSVESKLGEGSTFLVSFLKGRSHYDKDVEYLLTDDANFSNTENEPEKNNDEELVDSNEKDKELMLLVEDNIELRSFLKVIFTEKFRIIEASNGLEGMSKALQFVPDIIISDVMMPEKDGFEMTNDLRMNLTTSHIPIVLLTAKSTTDDELTGLGFGADAYITKPFSSVYLQARVSNLLVQRRKLQEIYRSQLMNRPSAEEVAPDSEENLPDKSPETDDKQELSPNDQKFMDKLIRLMEKQIDNGDLMVDDLAKELAVSRSVFFKKLKALTGLAPIEFIREMRIKRAVQLMESGDYSITEISEMVGINDSRYFSKCFKRVYGMTPTEYKEQKSHINKQNLHN